MEGKDAFEDQYVWGVYNIGLLLAGVLLECVDWDVCFLPCILFSSGLRYVPEYS
jgi:hypothetical protein